MESKDKLKEIDIKNRTCYHFDYTRLHTKLQRVQNHCVLGTMK